MKFIETSIPGTVIIEPDVFRDPRGFFLETYHIERYREAGIVEPFVQDNHSYSTQGTLRGLHYQLKKAQDKLVYVITGEIFDVFVDIRRGSPTFGQWLGTVLSADNKRQIFAPKGLAHGFCVLSEAADVIYKCTDLYAPDDEYGIFWADPGIGIDWPIENPILSKKDSQNSTLKEIKEDFLPIYRRP